MLAISVEFLHGTFRGDPDGTAITGELTRGEWPPSPARLFAALVAADGTRHESRVTNGDELLWLENLPAPSIHAQASPSHQVLLPRFVVAHGGQKRRTHQEYVAREGALHRPGVRIATSNPVVVYRWDIESPNSAILASVERRAARVGYLGASDSPVRVRVSTEMPHEAADEAWVPDPGGDIRISVPHPGNVAALDRVYDAWKERGASLSRAQFPALLQWENYRSPDRQITEKRGEVVAWLRLHSAVSGRRIATVTGLFKDAVLSRYQRLHGEPPAILHGHGFTSSGYDLARYLALPDVGHPRSRGRIHGLALWLPPEADDLQRRRAREAAYAIDALAGRGISARTEPRVDDKRPWAANPRRWRGPSSVWVSAFPVIHERRGPPNLAAVSRWCRHAGLPPPIAFRSSRTPLLPGAVDLAPTEVNRPGRPALPYSHAEFRFAEPIAGPVAIGAGRQRGFGLCVPVNG